jgi:competence protein ComEC
VTVGGVRAVLMGDAEVEEQNELVGSVGPADVLKTAHHGSAFQSPELLDEIHPRIALVSVGEGNVYGHPNPGVMQRLARGGARVLRTDLEGDLAVIREAGGGLAVAVAS